MSDASETARASVDAFLQHDQDAIGQLLAPDVEWLENGLPHHESFPQHEGRGKWEGAHPQLDVDVIEVCSNDDTAVFEFDMRHDDKATLGSAVFRVADGKIKSVHWYGHPDLVMQVLWPNSAAAA